MQTRHEFHRDKQTATDSRRDLTGTPSRQRMPATLAALSLLLLLPVSGCAKKEVTAQAAPPDVKVAEVLQQDVPIFAEWVAQLNGPVNADITPKVQGYLLKQDYVNGSMSYASFASAWQSLLTSSANSWATANHVDLSKY